MSILIQVLLFVSLAAVAAALLAAGRQKNRRLAQEQGRSLRLAFLNRIQRLGVSSLETDHLLSEIVGEIQRSFGFERVRIKLRSPGGEESQWKARAAQNATGSGQKGKTGKFSRKAPPQGKPLKIAFPILVSGEKAGDILLERAGKEFPSQEKETFEELAEYLGAVLQNTITYHHTQQLAITDSLTGLKTRRYFLEALHAEWKRSSRSNHPFSVVILDLDKFKAVNDTQGHPEGDRLLAALGTMLLQRCRQSNVVARYGGDEFVFLLPEASTQQAVTLAERMRSWVRADALFQQKRVTASFGVASYPRHGYEPEAVVQTADTALYVSKKRGGDCVSCPPQASTDFLFTDTPAKEDAPEDDPEEELVTGGAPSAP